MIRSRSLVVMAGFAFALGIGVPASAEPPPGQIATLSIANQAGGPASVIFRAGGKDAYTRAIAIGQLANVTYEGSFQLAGSVTEGGKTVAITPRAITLSKRVMRGDTEPKFYNLKRDGKGGFFFDPMPRT